MFKQLSLPSKINPAMKIHLKKNAAANGLELKERLQGLTATDVTHSRKLKAAILISHI